MKCTNFCIFFNLIFSFQISLTNPFITKGTLITGMWKVFSIKNVFYWWWGCVWASQGKINKQHSWRPVSIRDSIRYGTWLSSNREFHKVNGTNRTFSTTKRGSTCQLLYWAATQEPSLRSDLCSCLGHKCDRWLFVPMGVTETNSIKWISKAWAITRIWNS